jgi:hypothetical protein
MLGAHRNFRLTKGIEQAFLLIFFYIASRKTMRISVFLNAISQRALKIPKSILR